MKIKIEGNYADRRKAEYPPLTELADAMFHASNGDDTKLAEYLAKVQAVKDRFPKPAPTPQQFED